ncbi:U-box domain-containing protein 26-like [Wolffia australiana]
MLPWRAGKRRSWDSEKKWLQAFCGGRYDTTPPRPEKEQGEEEATTGVGSSMLGRERSAMVNCSRSIAAVESRPDGEDSAASIPHLFRCPISLDLFTDPVTLSTGQTYDRASIERWLAAGNRTCPVTMQPLADPSLVPNHTLRHLIDRWLLAGDPAALKLTLLSSPAETLRKIRTLAAESDGGPSRLRQSGFLPLLLRLLQDEPELAELTLDCILNVCPSPRDAALGVLKEPAFLSSVVSLLEGGSLRVRAGLCALLESASSNEELGLELGRDRRLVGGLVGLLGGRCGDAAAGALAGLCRAEPNRVPAVRAGAVEGLVGYLSQPRRKNAAKALATLERLAATEAGAGAVLKCGGAVQVLVRRVFRVSAEDHGGEHAVGALLSVCRGSAQARREAVKARALTQLLLLLQSQCGAKAKNRARDLLKLLSSFWVDDPTSAYANLL